MNIFPTPLLVGKSDNENIRTKIQELMYKHKETTDLSRLLSEDWNKTKFSSDKTEFDKKGVTTFGTKNLIDDKEWTEVVSFIKEFSALMIDDAYHGACGYGLSNVWSTVYPKGAYVPEHVHSNSMLSGVFYAKTPKNCGNIIFKDPSWVTKTMMFVKNAYPPNLTNYEFEVEEGLMILFPAWLPHSTNKNESDEDRIIVSFNIEFYP